MKYLLLIGLLALAGCDRNIAKDLETNNHGQVTINGKNCEVISISVGTGGAQRQVLFVDCGVGSSSTTYTQGKTTQTVGEYIPPKTSESPCPCRRTDDGRIDCPTPPCVKIIEPAPANSADIKKAREELREVKKDFYK